MFFFPPIIPAMIVPSFEDILSQRAVLCIIMMPQNMMLILEESKGGWQMNLWLCSLLCPWNLCERQTGADIVIHTLYWKMFYAQDQGKSMIYSQRLCHSQSSSSSSGKHYTISFYSFLLYIYFFLGPWMTFTPKWGKKSTRLGRFVNSTAYLGIEDQWGVSEMAPM